MNHSKLSAIPPTILGETLSGACIYCWPLKNIQIELLKIQIDPSLPPGMKVSRCIAFLWRFKNSSKKMDLQFSCRFLPKQAKLKGEPESGEGLIAQSWSNANGRLTIGTEDEEDLVERAENQQWLPSRFAKKNLLIPEMLEYLEDGIRVSLPALEENEQGQIQFIIAWIEGNNRNDYSTWQAVDMSYTKVLEFAGK
ncbi:MAG TPA: hypothetical protein VHK67_04010 [Rhabdochlamydiaceae bacterium]|jgi:hypothetical protein|nr:hypothetical protein [Rhabdochlamydiaceae bacterium]